MENVKIIELNELESEVRSYFDQGYRFVTLDCIQEGDQIQFLYHFDKDLELSHFRLYVDRDTVVPSMSHIYMCMFLIENEIQDMFGMKFSDLVIDYQGRLLLTDEVPPAPQVISNMVVSISQKDKQSAENAEEADKESDQKGVS